MGGAGLQMCSPRRGTWEGWQCGGTARAKAVREKSAESVLC